MPTNGISGLAVAAAAAGGFLVYAGIKDVDLITGLREIAGGKTPTGRAAVPTAVFGTGTSVGTTAGNVAGSVGASTGGSGGALIAAARQKLGKPYVWAAVGPNSYDCSGLVSACICEVQGRKVKRLFTTHTFAVWARANGWTKVGEKYIAAGDVVLKSGHMGIAISNTEMIHAPNRTTVVKYGKIFTPRYMWSGWRMPVKPNNKPGTGSTLGPPQYG